MSNDFWLGMAAIPAAAVAVAIIAAAIFGLIWASARFSVDEYKLLKRTQDYNRGNLAATVACAKWTRYCWIPGWHLILCRTTMADAAGEEIERQHIQVRDAVQQATQRSGSLT